MGQDLELQQHLAELKRSGQAELTRQRALDKLDVPSFIKTCKVWFAGGGGAHAAGAHEHITRQRALDMLDLHY